MKDAKKLVLIVICSFALAIPLDMEQRSEVSMNGCTMERYPQMSYFYEEKKDSIEVLMLGDSNVYRGFSPLIYWQDTNITSYSFASASQPAWLSYYALKDALQYQKPKVVVFEINELFAAMKDKPARYCRTINSMHSTATRLHAIADPASGFQDEDRHILYRKFVKDTFHTTLQKMLMKEKHTGDHEGSFKGYLLNTSTLPYGGGNSYMERYDPQLQISKEHADYIDKIIALCKEQNITLLFVKLPTKEWTAQKQALASSFANDRGIPLLDLNASMEELDWSKDTKDSGFHMNDAGAEKVTRRLEVFIQAYGHPEITKDQEVIDSFNVSLKRYQAMRKQIHHQDRK